MRSDLYSSRVPRSPPMCVDSYHESFGLLRFDIWILVWDSHEANPFLEKIRKENR